MTNSAEIERIRLSSNYLDTLLRSRPDYADWLWDRKQLYRRYPLTGLYQNLQVRLQSADSLASLMRIFREFKQRHFLRIGGRDLLGLSALEETTSQLSDLAMVTIQGGLEYLRSHPQWWLAADHRDLWQSEISRCRLVVMGFGKLGGEELNYVSDVDICVFRESSDPRVPPSALLIFLVRQMVQHLGRLLADPVSGDRVFQVDFRLRPGGKEGELVPSVGAAAEHYLNHGLTWERQMLLKARPIAGDRSLGMAFLQELRPFIFRRFLDFQALDELRAMRDRILSESKRMSQLQGFDVKLGVGGIREIEFMVQSFQLIYAGRHAQLDEPNTLRCLAQLQQLQLLPESVVADLREAYVFLRRIEHWIQLDQNRQTQKLPKSAEARKRLALAMGFDGDFGALEAALQRICSLVQGHFSSLFSARSDPGDGDGELDNQAGRSDLEAIWEQPAFSNLKGVLKPFPRSVRSLLAGVLAGLRREGRRSPVDVVGNRLELYFNRVSHRAGLMRLFDAPGPWMEKLCCGISQSGMLASLLAHQPNLVEGIASIRDVQLNAADWEQFGEQLLAHHQDFEEAIEWVRRLKNERMLMIALADLAGESTQPEVERHLTHLALFVIRKTYERVAGKLQAPPDLPLSILGLGKLGSGELNYLSDLDLMYVYDPQPDEPPDRIPSQVVRLIQRLNHMLSMPLQEGPGYVVDTRLRPTGNYGPLVTTRSAWEDYYAKDADLWEIQALLRMQPVAGNRELSERLAERAGEICHSPRNPAEVWPRLCHLRRRMEGERSGDQEGWIDLKLGYGGVVDMEFLVQGQQLLASPHESLVTIRSVREALPHALARVDVGTVGASETVALFNAFRTLEHRLHLHLNLSTSKLKEEQFEALLDFGLWPIENDRVTIAGWEELKAARRRIRAVWEKICSQWPDA